MSVKVFEVSAEIQTYRYLISEAGWEFNQPFLAGKPVSTFEPIKIRFLTLEEDIREEEELRDDGDDGDPEFAHQRFSRGVGDCACVSGFHFGLCFSKKAKVALENLLRATGQLFPVEADGVEFFLYNCTNLLPAVDVNKSHIRCLSKGRPSQFQQIGFKSEIIENQYLFKVHWPNPIAPDNLFDSSSIPPPTPIFATQRFVDLVKDHQLIGFHFKQV